MTVKRIGILTSGGDAPGMNPAVRAIVRRALDQGAEVFGILNGYEGMVHGEDMIHPLNWDRVGGILHRGGTILGTARSADFRTREGRKRAGLNLARLGIDGLVVIGGDGSLTGALYLSREWPTFLQEWVASGDLTGELAGQAAELQVVGLPGSIDNDLFGTDMSIGADTALQRILRAIDDLVSTADSHQRIFVVETMGRNCGYLALFSGLAGAAQWVLIPEEEMEPRWHVKMVNAVHEGREAGRRHAVIVVAEGARHPDGLRIDAEQVCTILSQQLGAEARLTVLGHVQRGGPPSAFDRNLATRLGAAAVDDLIASPPGSMPRMIGLRANRIASTPLPEVIEKSQAVGKAIDSGDYATALQLRGRSFNDVLNLVKTLSRSSVEYPPAPEQPIAILTSGADAPGMNTAVRVAARIALTMGRRVLGVHNGLTGLANDDLEEFNWMSVNGWQRRGGTELGATRFKPAPEESSRIAETIARRDIGGLIVIGGLGTYLAVKELADSDDHPLNLPVVLVPATIDNNLPGTDFSVGADTALNNIVDAVDKIKTTAASTHRAFVIEVMGRQCGFLGQMSGLATGAERTYIPEEGIHLAGLHNDVRKLLDGFRSGKRLGLVIRSEGASQEYDTNTLARIMEAESDNLFEVRTAILGHLQRGGVPTPFDRIQASRMAAAAVRHLVQQIKAREVAVSCVGLRGRGIEVTPLTNALADMNLINGRPAHEWFMDLRPLAHILAKPWPGWEDKWTG